ncbi:MAG: sodium:alanine symporter family protein [Oscillospiraceae bacterium]|nr:sodium:alanine symporter family protein [Oscillospiraceae bacterium]
MTKILQMLNEFVWGIPALILILGVGIYLTVRTGFVQIRLFPRAVGLFFDRLRGGKSEDGTVSAFQALCTALAATVGTGNLAGVAGAIAIGGPGAVFWMWVCGWIGMATKFAEATLAVRCRVKDPNGDFVGGPMYMIRGGMGKKWQWLAVLYSFFGVVAAFGVGNATQVNAVVGGINEAIIAFGGQETRLGNLLMGVLLAVLIASMLLGGMRRIGKVAERLVPFASAAYILLGIIVLIARANYLDDAFISIFQGAFSPRAVTGGVVGSAFSVLRVGVSRGVFTNEAGMGTASIAHASAKVSHPAEQGLMGIMEVFLDTIVICTVTALVILVSGVIVPYGEDVGITLTAQAFAEVAGSWTSIFIALALCCFAIATVLGWGLYGVRCAQFLFGTGVWKKFVLLQAVTVVLGAVLKTGTVWLLSETVNGLMAIPNLIALAALSPELAHLTKEYKQSLAGKPAKGGTYENFHQCQPL